MLEAPLVKPVLRAAPQAKLARPEALQVRPVPQVASLEKPVRLEQVALVASVAWVQLAWSPV